MMISAPNYGLADQFDNSDLQALFEQMAPSYDQVSSLGSLGIINAWRKRCIATAQIQPGMVVGDLLCGGGEAWPWLEQALQGRGSLIALDLVAQPLNHSIWLERIEVHNCDIFANRLPSQSLDRVVCCFGLKTFCYSELVRFAGEIRRLLRPDGRFSLIEIGTGNSWVGSLGHIYLQTVLPLLARGLGAPSFPYRQLAPLAQHFGTGKHVLQAFKQAGLLIEHQAIWGGLAHLFSGSRDSFQPMCYRTATK